jgi:elongation factor 1-beta
MEKMKAKVLAIEMDGLVWGASKFVEIGYGIKKLQVNLVVEDDKVFMDDLQDKIAEDEDNVQSSDIVHMQKL